MRVSDINLANQITNKRARAYSIPPKRLLTNENLSQELNEIYKEFGFNRAFKEFDYTFNRSRYGALWLVYREEVQEFQLIPLAPYEFDTVRNKDTGKTEVFILNYPDATITSNVDDGSDNLAQLIAESQSDGAPNSKVYALWTDTQHSVVKINRERIKTAKGTEIKLSVDFVPLENNESNVNPLGVLPFVFLSNDLSVDYPTPNPLAEQSVDFNIGWSDLLSAAALQGFGQMVFKYPEGSKLEKVHTGLTTAIELPQSRDPNSPPTEADYINPSPDLNGQLEVLTRYGLSILSDHGITSSQGIAGGAEKFSSGLERMIANADVQSIISNNQDLYSWVEAQVFEIFKAWQRNVLNNPAFENEELKIIYPKPKVQISDKEVLENIEKRLNLGLIEKFEALMILDPNMTPDAAQEKLERIKKEKQENAQSFFNTPVNPNDEDDEDGDKSR